MWYFIKRCFICQPSKFTVSKNAGVTPTDGILGYQLNKRLLLADYKENHTLLWFLKSLQKSPQNKKTRVNSWIAWKNEGGNQTKTCAWEDSSYAQKPRLKMLIKNSISGLVQLWHWQSNALITRLKTVKDAENCTKNSNSKKLWCIQCSFMLCGISKKNLPGIVEDIS